jgi:SAM-dependent methyltransferase
MTWHETIDFIRRDPEYAALVEQAYFDENLDLNISRFGKSGEFQETIRIIKDKSPGAQTILDIGAGNGIASINFALLGYSVYAVEPDDSASVGTGAINKSIEKQKLKNVSVFQQYAEKIEFPDEMFDVVYFRQTMHHANNLLKFLQEAARVVKAGGLVMAVRDHVIFNDGDKRLFLENHPLQKFYGGENAFTPAEYRDAIRMAGLTLERELKYYDSILNYFPLTEDDVETKSEENKKMLKRELISKVGLLGKIPIFLDLYKNKNSFNALPGHYLNERVVSGRMYSYIARKVK